MSVAGTRGRSKPIRSLSMDVGEVDVKVGHPNPLTKVVATNDDGGDVFAKALVESVSTSYLNTALRRKAYRKNVKAGEGSKSIADEETGYTLLEVAEPRYNLDKLASLYESSVPNAAAIRAKTSNIVGFGYDLVIKPEVQFKIDQKEQAARKNAMKRAALARFDVDTWLTGRCKSAAFLEVLNRVWTDYESTGNAYIEVGRRPDGQIGYLGHIPATTMRIRKARDGFVQVSSNRVQFFRNFGDTKTRDPVGNDPAPYEVIHLFKYSPTSGYYGVPDIVSALTAVAGNKYAEDYNLEYFENKAVPRYIIKTKGPELSFSAQAKIVEFFSTNLKGSNHRTVYIPLPPDTQEAKNDFSIEPVEAHTQDSSFANYFKTNLSIILMAHGVSHTKVLAVPDDGTLAAAKDFDKTFKEQRCRPEQRMLNYYINLIVHEYTDIFNFELKELTLTDEATQSEIDDREIKNGVTVPNEVRARKGQPEIVDGDKTYAQVQQEVAEASQTDPTAQPRAEAKSQATNSRARDAARTAKATDSAGKARNPKGDGRTVA